jgi:two-component system, OmpR family, response regulator
VINPPFESVSNPPIDTPAGAPVLVVEDERDLAEEIRLELQASGHPVQLTETVDEGLRAARLGAAVLVIDRMLQGRDGLSITETLRAEGNATPALVISALSSVDDRINGLKAGGDDYLIKPFDIRELTARVEALLRRGGDARLTRLQVGPLEMDLVERSVRSDGKAVDLLPREFTLLEYFMRRPGQVVTRRCCSRMFGISTLWRKRMSSMCRSAICGASSTPRARDASLSISGPSASN